MKQTVVVGLDLAKNLFQVHGMDADGAKTFNKKLRREEVKTFLGISRLASSLWKLEAHVIFEPARSVRLDTKR
ncbi:hypothetical protein [Rhizobium sp. YK2]|uniref:hypothetical protein n=1 Tax=Rhizobium sp. YK2 TaxID=1860096 RepID=UPI00084BF0B4|nr:hypothetical protein [Rhizobium sp. YK2]OED00685.1 hypothetical protein A9Z06_11980 [Rhizobium sp. YK2]